MEGTHKAFKIFTAGSQPRTLFHGINRSRTMPVGRWIAADKRIVSDGGTKYLSGFHVLLSEQDCHAYLRHFKRFDDKRIIEVSVRGPLRAKTHSPHPVFLADEILIPEGVW